MLLPRVHMLGADHATESPRTKEEADAAMDAATVGAANGGGKRA